MDEIKRALEIAEQIPFRFLMQHLGTPNESFSEKKFEAAMTSIEHLRAFAKPLGVRILLENIPNELSTPDKLVEMIQQRALRRRRRLLRLRPRAHDELGTRSASRSCASTSAPPTFTTTTRLKDSHLWPGQGTIDWKEAMELLRSAPQTPPLLLELGEDEKVNPLEKLGETFEKLETARSLSNWEIW